jgi:tripartite-type tricarboxylate transporter receptor subunit TctC
MSIVARTSMLFIACMGAAGAQTFPAKPLRLVVGFVAGGPSDFVARLVGQGMAERLGQQVVVENRPGASGIVGAELVAKAAPDGYTLYLASQTTHAVAPAMYSKVGYDSLKDFAPIARVAHNPLLLVVHPSVPVKSVNDLLALARARPGQLNFATGGIGSSPHMSMELVKSMTKIDMVPVNYKGDGAAIIDLLGGHVPVFQASIGTLLPHVRNGRMRGIAVTSLKRSTMAPEIPTWHESGLKGLEVLTWFGLLATAGTPQQVIARLNADALQAVSAPAAREQLLKNGFEILSNTPEEYAAYLKDEVVRWGKIVRDLKLKAQ